MFDGDFDFDLSDAESDRVVVGLSPNAGYAIGGGAILLGGLLLAHQIRGWLARRKLDRMRDAVARGEIPTRDFLEEVLKTGQPSVEGAFKVSVAEAKLLSCDVVFPAGLSTLPEFRAAIEELRRKGTCR